MKKYIFPVLSLLGLGLLGMYLVSLTGPNEYAARIAEAQADLETARALRDQAEAIQVIAGGLNRVSLVQSLTLLLIIVALVGLGGLYVYTRLQRPQVGPAKAPAALGQVAQGSLPEGSQGLDPALVNQMIQLEMLRTLRGLSAPQVPANIYPEERKG